MANKCENICSRLKENTAAQSAPTVGEIKYLTLKKGYTLCTAADTPFQRALVEASPLSKRVRATLGRRRKNSAKKTFVHFKTRGRSKERTGGGEIEGETPLFNPKLLERAGKGYTRTLKKARSVSPSAPARTMTRRGINVHTIKNTTVHAISITVVCARYKTLLLFCRLGQRGNDKGQGNREQSVRPLLAFAFYTAL